MFDEDDASEPNFEEELADDVKEECIKFGEIRHTKVDKQSMLVYIRFANIAASQLAHPALNGRWFAGKMLTCSYISEPAYLQLWPAASSN
jgi:RNA-binding protein 39